MILNIYKLSYLDNGIMANNNSSTHESELRYAQWNPFFHSLQKDINEIREINKVIRDDFTLIHNLFSKIKTLFNNHRHYISNSKVMDKSLTGIENKIYSPSFLAELKNRNPNPEFLFFVRKVIRTMESINQEMYNSFSQHELLPKVNLRKKANPSEAILNLG